MAIKISINVKPFVFNENFNLNLREIVFEGVVCKTHTNKLYKFELLNEGRFK